MPLTEKEAAALERLEAEKKRRIEDKIQSGEAVRMPVLIVGSVSSIAAVKARTLAAMRAAGEKREIFPADAEEAIITGVPRPGREPENYKPPISSELPAPSIFDRRSAPRDPREPTAPKQEPSGIEAEWRRVWATVERPSETNPGGAIVEGLYRVEEGMVKVTDLQGRLLGTQPLKPGSAPARFTPPSHIPRHRCIKTKAPARLATSGFDRHFNLRLTEILIALRNQNLERSMVSVCPPDKS
jgi:hypothetical protein